MGQKKIRTSMRCPVKDSTGEVLPAADKERSRGDSGFLGVVMVGHVGANYALGEHE